jgi:predicted DCC family thiol-disulfide oxidoreductase YuxK
MEKSSRLRPVNQGYNLFMMAGRIRLLVVLMILALGLWIVFAKLVGPAVIDSAYRGESWSFLNGMIRGQAESSVSDYIQKWDKLTISYLLSGLGFWLLVLMISSPAFIRRIVGEATPGSLGAIRMWTCLILLLATVWEDLPSIALLPVEMRQSLGVMQYFYTLPIGFERFVTSETSLRAFQWLTELILFLGLIGWRTRLVIPLGALCACVFYGILRDYSFFWHQYLVPVYVMAVLSWTPCGDGWSVDRLRKVYQGRAVPDPDRGSLVYGWSRYACWVVIALPYVAAGMSKLRSGGLLWWNATNMKSMLFRETLDTRDFDWALSLHLSQAPAFLFALLGLVALLGELSFGMVLFSRIARRILPVLMMMTHIGILLLQKILFLDLILLQFVFFDFRRIRKAIGERVAASHGRIQVLYDGLCPLCRRTVRLLACFDLFARLDFFDFRRLNLTDYNRSHKLNLTPQDLEAEMYVISRGRAYRGFYGYRAIALTLPAFWPLAPWLFLPGVSSLGASLYGYVARNRLKLLRCDSHCALQSSEESRSDGATRANDANRGFGYVLAVSGVIFVLLYCWFYHIEFYPFTGMPMFTGVNTSGVITYDKILAHRESGAVSPARIEDSIGAMAHNARYGRVFAQCIEPTQPTDVDICEKFLHVTASAYNKKARPGETITKYEFQRWIWDFRSNPLDPNYGNLTERFIFEIKDGALPQNAHNP